MTSTLAPLLGGLALVLFIGMLARRVFGWGGREADVLNGLVVDVTLPALLFVVLGREGIQWRAAEALPAATIALFVSLVLGAATARAFGLRRAEIGSAALVAGFSNTGFLGLPLTLALFPGKPTAFSAALLCDVCITTALLWTVGRAFAERMGTGKPFEMKTALLLLVKPMMLATALGAISHELGLSLPRFALDALDGLGKATSPLVFLSLGLSLDVRALSGRAFPVFALCVIKLFVMPLVALGFVRLFRAPPPMATVAVLQSAMPSALITAIVAAQAGADRHLAVAVCTLTTLASIGSLPAVVWILEKAAG